jgi:hypothetical protein
MSNEILKQPLLAELINEEYKNLGLKAKAYSGGQFKRIDGHHQNKLDLIIIDSPIIFHPMLKVKEVMRPIIGLEMKDETSYGTIVKGLDQTANYFNHQYHLTAEHLDFKLSSLAFTTTNSIANGIVAKEFSDNKAIERFAWNKRVAILLNYKHKLVWSFRNYYFNLAGNKIGRFGEHATFIEY